MAKNKKGSCHKKYSKKFFSKTLPANHNPLIGSLHGDTLHNIHDAIALLQELSLHSDDGLMPSPSANMGYYFLMSCILNALRFELYNRKDK
jgi:hypothetical protein